MWASLSMSKVIILANHRPGLLISHYLLNRKEDEVIAIYLSEEITKVDDRIKSFARMKQCPIYHYKTLEDLDHRQYLVEQGLEFLISIYWPYYIKPDVYHLPSQGTINFHASLLPLNKGCYPHLFNLLEGTPAGVSLHEITDTFDEGAVWAQRSVLVTPYDTAKSLYERLQFEIVDLFKKSWPKISSGKVAPIKQEGEGSYHSKNEIKSFNEIDLNKTYTGRELINLLRARSLGDLGFAYYQDGEDRVYVNLRTSKSEKFGA